MNIIELRNDAIDLTLAHKAKVERFADEYLIKSLTISTIKKLYDNIKDLKRSIASQDLSQDKVDAMNKKINTNLNKLKKEFIANKLKISNLVPKYWCKKCKDTGFNNGKICSCINAMTTKMLMSMDENTTKSAVFDLTTFDIFEEPEYMKSIYSKAKTFVDKMDTTKYNNFTIIGGVGVGKTHLMECMANRAIQNNKYVIYLSAFKLNQTFLNYHTSPMAGKVSIIEPLLNCDMLCIDDLGAEQMLNNVTVPMLTMLINERNIAKKKTILTSNLSMDDIRERYDYRLCSRLLDKDVSITVMVNGVDLRQKSRSASSYK